jgi:glycosyltransferase involved in cell wall biosynthesis
MKKISLIITTYNRPQALGLVLLSLAAQKGVDFNDFVASRARQSARGD